MRTGLQRAHSDAQVNAQIDDLSQQVSANFDIQVNVQIDDLSQQVSSL